MNAERNELYPEIFILGSLASMKESKKISGRYNISVLQDIAEDCIKYIFFKVMSCNSIKIPAKEG